MVGPCLHLEKLVRGIRTLRRQIGENSFPAYEQVLGALTELLRNYGRKEFSLFSGWTE